MENCATHQSSWPRRLFIAARQFVGINAFIILVFAQSAQVNAQSDKQEHAQMEAAAAPAVLLQLKPNRCVALHQGQVCYQNVQLLWSAPQPGHYCLYLQNTAQPLNCWQNVNVGEYRYEFASDTSLQLHLVNEQTKTVIAQAELEVAWVYKANTRRQTHWRLF